MYLDLEMSIKPIHDLFDVVYDYDNYFHINFTKENWHFFNSIRPSHHLLITYNMELELLDKIESLVKVI